MKQIPDPMAEPGIFLFYTGKTLLHQYKEATNFPIKIFFKTIGSEMHCMSGVVRIEEKG